MTRDPLARRLELRARREKNQMLPFPCNVGRRAGEHLEQDPAQRKDVGALVQQLRRAVDELTDLCRAAIRSEESAA